MKTRISTAIVAFSLIGFSAFADGKPAEAPMMHRPDPKRVKDFESCQKDAGIPTPTADQLAKARDCMMKKKPTAPKPPPDGDKMAFIRAQMDARMACDTEAGINMPSKDQMASVHKCMESKGYDMYHQPRSKTKSSP